MDGFAAPALQLSGTAVCKKGLDHCLDPELDRILVTKVACDSEVIR